MLQTTKEEINNIFVSSMIHSNIANFWTNIYIFVIRVGTKKSSTLIIKQLCKS